MHRKKVMLGQFFVILCCLITVKTVFASEKFISLADIHFTPFTDCEAHIPCPLILQLRESSASRWGNILSREQNHSISKRYEDTNYFLLQSALMAAHQVAQKNHPAFVVILGDFLGHHYQENYKKYSKDRSATGYQVFVRRTFEFLTLEIQKTFPDTPVYFVVGNNDSYTGNYRTVTHGAFFHEMTALWRPLMHDHNHQEAFEKQFPEAGYYTITLPHHPDAKIMVLNTVLLTARLKLKKMQSAADAEFQWLQQELKKAEQSKQKVMLMFHIPPGIDVYASFTTGFIFIRHFWHSAYEEKFSEVIRQFPETVSGIFPAHIHIEWYKVGAPRVIGNSPVFFTPSISPIYGNDPAFKLFEYDVPDLKVVSVHTYRHSLDESVVNRWEEG